MEVEMDVSDHLIANRFETIRWGVRALQTEICQFSFAYPLELDLAAGPRNSLHYYVYSESLAWDALRLDDAGIAMCSYPTTGPVYRPGFVAWYGLNNLGYFLRHQDDSALQIFLRQVDWLTRNVVSGQDGAIVWAHHFDCKDGSTLLKAPWLSANAQGLAISALVRAWRITRKPQLIELLDRSWRVFEIPVPRGGLQDVVAGQVLFTELRGRAILDHVLNALLGLYDLHVENGDRMVGELFEKGVQGLKRVLHTWDYRNKWSWYGAKGYLSPPAYHCANRQLLKALGRVSNEHRFIEYADRWDPERLSAASRLRLFAAFIYTKNRSRLYHRTWKYKRTRFNADRAFSGQSFHGNSKLQEGQEPSLSKA